MKIKLIILFLFFCQFGLLFGQRANLKDPRIQLEAGKKFFCDIYVLPDKASDSVLVTVLYRVTKQTLTFIKINSEGNDNFWAVPNFEVEFKDEDGIIRKRIFREDSIITTNYEESVSKDYIYGFVSVKMKTGKYNITANLRCSNSQLKINKIFPFVEFKNFQKEPVISEPVITSALDPDKSQTSMPYILSLGIPFSSDGASILIPVTYYNEFEKFKCTLKYSKSKERLFDWGDNINISGSIIPIKNSSLKLVFKNPNENPVILLIPFNSDSGKFKQGVLNIHINADKVVPGNYEMNIVRENSKDTLKRNINVIWEDMPVVLIDPEYAVGSMYYILTDAQYEKMSDGTPQEISKKILEYWKEKDPTKTTAYNEAMAEYFKRVEYAMLNFKNKNFKDGMKTDRGKIYILYGPPAKTNKQLGEKQNTEVWLYDKLKKEFTFKTDNAGNYILVSVNDVK